MYLLDLEIEINIDMNDFFSPSHRICPNINPWALHLRPFLMGLYSDELISIQCLSYQKTETPETHVTSCLLVVLYVLPSFYQQKKVAIGPYLQ